MTGQEPQWLTDREQRAWQAYRRMFLLLNAQISRDLQHDSKLSDPDYDVLSNLGAAPDRRRRVSELADRMLWSRSRLSHHLARMEQRGLVAREGVATDGRGAVVALTDQGMRTLDAAAPAHVASVRRHFIDLLSPAQLDVLAELGETVVERLAREPGPASAPGAAGPKSAPGTG